MHIVLTKRNFNKGSIHNLTFDFQILWKMVSVGLSSLSSTHKFIYGVISEAT